MSDDYSADRFTTGAVAVGGSATATIETAHDQDWFAVELVAGRTYQFDLGGSPSGGGTLSDTFLRAIYDSEGRYQSDSYNDDFGGSRDSRVTFTASQSGTYYVRASGDRDETGSYTLSVRDVTPSEAGNPPPAGTGQDQDTGQSISEGDTDLPNDASTPGRVAVAGSATGTIGTAGDQDRFAIELVAGRTYQFDLTGSPGGGGASGHLFPGDLRQRGTLPVGQLQRRLRGRPRQPGDVHGIRERDLLRASVGRPERDRELHAARDRRDAAGGGVRPGSAGDGA